MTDNYLITGYWGEPHVTAENDRGIHAAIFGKGRFVLPVGERFRAEYIGNNTVRMYDGKLMDNGAAAGIPAGRYIDLLIPEAGQGKNRTDLIVFQYKKDPSTLVESGTFVVIHGEETDGFAYEPVLTNEDLLSDSANLDQMALWRVSVSATVISAPVRVFSMSRNMQTVSGMVTDAASSDGQRFMAFVDGIEELTNGLTITIIPQSDITSNEPTLNLNNLGAKKIMRRWSGSNATFLPLSDEDSNIAGFPITLTYCGDRWVIEDKKPGATDLHGTVQIDHGGTGGNTLEKAQKKLQIHPAVESTDYPGCYYRTVGDEQEWINPPMVTGVEYRTTERFMGVPVYTKIVTGYPPAIGESGKITIAMGISGLLRIECYNTLGHVKPASAPYSYEVSTTILRGTIDNSESGWDPGESVAFRAWFIRADLASLTNEG